VSEASYTAWDDNLYEWPPPEGWYQANDGKWWPEGYGPAGSGSPDDPSATPGPNEHASNGTEDANASLLYEVERTSIFPAGGAGLVGTSSSEERIEAESQRPVYDELPPIDDVFGGSDPYADDDEGELTAFVGPPPSIDDLPGISDDAEPPSPSADFGLEADGTVDDELATDSAGFVIEEHDFEEPTTDHPGPDDPAFADAGRPAVVDHVEPVEGHRLVDHVEEEIEPVEGHRLVDHVEEEIEPVDDEFGSVEDQHESVSVDDDGLGSLEDDALESVSDDDGLGSLEDDGLESVSDDDGLGSLEDHGLESVSVDDDGLKSLSVDDDGLGSLEDHDAEPVDELGSLDHHVAAVDHSLDAPVEVEDDFDPAAAVGNGVHLGELPEQEVDTGEHDDSGQHELVASGYPDDQGPDGSSRSSWPLIAAGLAVLLVAAGVGAFALLRQDEAPVGFDLEAALAQRGDGSLSEPYSSGTGVVVFYNDDVSGEQRRWVIQVVDTVSDRTDQLLAEGASQAPGDGEVLAVTRVRVTYQSGPSPGPSGDLALSSIGSSLTLFGTAHGCAGVDDELVLSAALEPGQAVEGNICWRIPSSDLPDLKLAVEARPVEGIVFMNLT